MMLPCIRHNTEKHKIVEKVSNEPEERRNKTTQTEKRTGSSKKSKWECLVRHYFGIPSEERNKKHHFKLWNAIIIWNCRFITHYTINKIWMMIARIQAMRCYLTLVFGPSNHLVMSLLYYNICIFLSCFSPSFCRECKHYTQIIIMNEQSPKEFAKMKLQFHYFSSFFVLLSQFCEWNKSKYNQLIISIGNIFRRHIPSLIVAYFWNSNKIMGKKLLKNKPVANEAHATFVCVPLCPPMHRPHST